MIGYRTIGIVAMVAGLVLSLLPEEAEAGRFRRRCRPGLWRSRIATCRPAPQCRPAPTCPTCPTCPAAPPRAKETDTAPTGPCPTGAVCIDYKIADVFDESGTYLYTLYAATECFDTPVLHYDAANNWPEGQDCYASSCECIGGSYVIDVPFDMLFLPDSDELQEPSEDSPPETGPPPTKAKVRKELVENGFATDPSELRLAVEGETTAKIVRVRCRGTERNVKLTRINYGGASFNVAWETDEAVTSDLTAQCRPIPGYERGYVIRERHEGGFYYYTLHLPRAREGQD